MKWRSLWHSPAPTVRTPHLPRRRVVDPDLLDLQGTRLLVQHGSLHPFPLERRPAAGPTVAAEVGGGTSPVRRRRPRPIVPGCLRRLDVVLRFIRLEELLKWVVGLSAASGVSTPVRVEDPGNGSRLDNQNVLYDKDRAAMKPDQILGAVTTLRVTVYRTDVIGQPCRNWPGSCDRSVAGSTPSKPPSRRVRAAAVGARGADAGSGLAGRAGRRRPRCAVRRAAGAARRVGVRRGGGRACRCDRPDRRPAR